MDHFRKGVFQTNQQRRFPWPPAVTCWPISKANKHFTRSRVQQRAPFYWKWHLIKPQVGTDSVWPQSNTKNRAADLFVFWPHAKKLLAWLEFPTRKWDIWRLNFPSAEKGGRKLKLYTTSDPCHGTVLEHRLIKRTTGAARVHRGPRGSI